MRKNLFLPLFLILGLGALLYFISRMPATVASAQPSLRTKISMETTAQNTPPELKVVFNTAEAQTLAKWTNAFPNLKLWSHFKDRSSWVSNQRNTNNYPTLLLTGVHGRTIQYVAKLMSVDAMGDHVRRIQLETPNMSITETRSLGDSLLQMMGKDPSSFDAWCNKVGNNWVDEPEFTSGGSPMPGNNEFYGFGTHITFNNQNPWYILFFISEH